MKPGDLVWVRAAVVQMTPRALLLSFQGPGGAPVIYAVDPNGVMLPYHKSPEPEEPTNAV
jgi:hypothetical protein